MVLCCVSIHWEWAFLLLAYPEQASGSTPIGSILKVIPNPFILALLLIFVGASALVSFFVRDKRISWFMLIPQQAMLMASASGAIIAIYLSRYSDGVIRPRPFITGDQVMINVMFWHTIALITFILKRNGA
jgi:hypothetical protein